MSRVVDLDSLTPDERLRLVQDLWDQLADDPGQVAVTDAQRSELDRRLADHRASPDDVVAWDDLKARRSK